MGGLEQGVSYVVTVYNKRALLPLVIEGLLRQKGDFPREFIFVDDGSTDGSRELLREAAAARPELRLIAQANAGPSRAFNRGLKDVRLGYVKALDGDNILLPDATLKLSARLTGPCRLAYGHDLFFDGIPPDLDRLLAGLPPAPPDRPELIAEHLPFSLRNSRMAPSAWMAETALVQESGGCDEEIFVQDYSIELRMVARTAVTRMNGPIYLSQATLDDNRLSSNGRQILADANRAVAHFFARHPEHLDRYGWFAARRTTGRAWLWASRHEGKTIFSGAYRRFLQGMLRLGDPLRLMRDSCGDFGGPLRR